MQSIEQDLAIKMNNYSFYSIKRNIEQKGRLPALFVRKTNNLLLYIELVEYTAVLEVFRLRLFQTAEYLFHSE